MPEIRHISSLSRQELYDLVWSMPTSKVALQFGISDVAVKKHCVKKNIPKPSRGYWAKIAVGIKPRRKPLPPSPAEVLEAFASRPVAKRLSLPKDGVPLHPVALKLREELSKKKPDFEKCLYLRAPQFPSVTISSTALAARVAKAFHVIVNGLEPMGIVFKNARSSYDAGFFLRGDDKLNVFIHETLKDNHGNERIVESWYWRDSGSPTERLAFTFEMERESRHVKKQWIETPALALGRLLPRIIHGVAMHFIELDKRRAQEAIEHKKRSDEAYKRHLEWEAQEAIRLKKEKEQMHVNAIKAMEISRRTDLFRAAEWWRLHHLVVEYVDECERQWKSSGLELSPEQQSWLAWAREIASRMSPFSTGYPDPSRHGAFDAAAIPFGGPYPAAQNFPQPPTIPAPGPS